MKNTKYNKPKTVSPWKQMGRKLDDGRLFAHLPSKHAKAKQPQTVKQWIAAYGKEPQK